MTQLSGFGSDALDITAACQQLALIAALYRDRRDAAEALLGPDGVVLIWVHQPASWLPSWCLIRSGPNRFFVALAGTTNGWQGGRHIDGSFGRPYVGQTNLLVNGQWLGAWEAIETDIIPQIPAGPGVTVYVSGHSYGGAVAQLGAYSLQQRSVYGRLECLAIGQPKALTAGYTGAVPAVYWRLTSWQDLVSTLPLENLVPGTDHWALPLVWRQLVADWDHYGSPAFLGQNGGIQGAGKDVVPVPPGVATLPISEHLLPNYSARLRQNLANFGGTADATRALDITDAVLTGGNVPIVPPGLPNVVPGPDGTPVTIPGAVPGSSGDPFFGGLSMPPVYPTPTSGRPMRINFLFETDGGAGWSENFLVVVTAGDPYTVAGQWAASYANFRRDIMSSAVRINAVRVSDDEVKRDSRRWSAPNNGLGYGRVTGKSSTPEDGWMWTLQDATRIVRSNNMLRGFPDDLVKDVTRNGNLVAPAPGVVRAYMTNVAPLFFNSWPAPDGGAGTLCIKSISRDPLTWITRRVTTMVGQANCTTKLTIDAAPGEYNIGDRIYLGTKRVKCVSGLSGYYDVVQTEIVGNLPVLTICKMLCCLPGDILCALPYVAKKVSSNIAVRFGDINRQTDRDAGRPFGQSRGRSKGKTC